MRLNLYKIKFLDYIIKYWYNIMKLFNLKFSPLYMSIIVYCSWGIFISLETDCMTSVLFYNEPATLTIAKKLNFRLCLKDLLRLVRKSGRNL